MQAVTHYPWQVSQWEKLQSTRLAGRLPHALLLSGVSGLGKQAFAQAFVKSFFCQTATISQQSDNCKCHACRLVHEKTHPDLLWVEPEKAGQAIKVDQIRELSGFIGQSGLMSLERIAVIHPAESMNINAANALLKTLEEPSEGSHILLVSNQPGSLPATIRSRCQQIIFPKPNKDIALKWLKESTNKSEQDVKALLHLAHGAPCAARELSESKVSQKRTEMIQVIIESLQANKNVLTLAGSLKEADCPILLQVVQTWLSDVMKLQLGVDESAILNDDFLTELQMVAHKVDLKRCEALLLWITAVQKSYLTGLNFNKRLIIETIFVRWGGCFVSRGAS